MGVSYFVDLLSSSDVPVQIDGLVDISNGVTKAVCGNLVGLWLLTAGDGSGIGKGELLSVLCALAFAVHILILSEVANRHDVDILIVTQFGFLAFKTLRGRPL